MKINTTLLAAAASFLFTQASFGGMTAIYNYSDGDGAFLCPTNTLNPGGAVEANLSIVGNQFRSPGHMFVDVVTDTELDPTITLNNVIDNDTSFGWAGYQVNIFMNKSFTINFATLNAPSGWSVTPFAPVAVNTSSNWFGQFTFTGSPAIMPAGQIDFTYQVSFLGSVRFTQEMIPIAVPEPAAASLLLGGGLLLGLMRRQRK
jgi:hypothetical protein